MTRNNWDRFAAGRFEEFLDRAEDHLLTLYVDTLIEPKVVTRSVVRLVLKDAQILAKRLKCPTERMVVLLAKCFIVLGCDFTTDPRFVGLRNQVHVFARSGSPQGNPIDTYLSRFECIASAKTARFSLSDIETLGECIDVDRGAALLEALADTKQTEGLFERDVLWPSVSAGLNWARELDLHDRRLWVLLAIFGFRFGPGFMRDPLLPSLQNLPSLRNVRTREDVLMPLLATIMETSDGR